MGWQEELLSSGALDEANLDRARVTAAAADDSILMRTMVDLGLISQSDLVDALCKTTGLARFDNHQDVAQDLDISAISKAFLKAQRVVPVSLLEDYVTVATAEPLNETLKPAFEFIFERPVDICVATYREIEDATENLSDANADELHEVDLEAADEDLIRLQELAGNAQVIKTVERVIEDAFAADASDIHFEPMADALRIRYRIDGILVKKQIIPKDLTAAVLSRLKIMANLDIAERRLPQDGRMKRKLNGRSIDFRVSTVASVHGEGIVLRLLDTGKLPEDFTSLGFDSSASEQLRKAVSKSDGIVLVTGPTGSGKTTTLYAGLAQLNSVKRKILTVEDPVEYLIAGINQVQVEPKIGRSFASTLRSFLRQDPDVIMVGEIRDRETAAIAIEAALTGHMVLSTLHTNDAATAVTRLLDMGLEDFLLASTLSLVVAQRLVRKLCPQCKKPVGGDDKGYMPVGCGSCNGQGYSGRVAITEMLSVSQQVKNLIRQHADAVEIGQVARSEGMLPMYEAGMRLVQEGITSHEEVLRVTRDIS